MSNDENQRPDVAIVNEVFGKETARKIDLGQACMAAAHVIECELAHAESMRRVRESSRHLGEARRALASLFGMGEFTFSHAGHLFEIDEEGEVGVRPLADLSEVVRDAGGCGMNRPDVTALPRHPTYLESIEAAQHAERRFLDSLPEAAASVPRIVNTARLAADIARASATPGEVCPVYPGSMVEYLPPHGASWTPITEWRPAPADVPIIVRAELCGVALAIAVMYHPHRAAFRHLNRLPDEAGAWLDRAYRVTDWQAFPNPYKPETVYRVTERRYWLNGFAGERPGTVECKPRFEGLTWAQACRALDIARRAAAGYVAERAPYLRVQFHSEFFIEPAAAGGEA